MGSLSAMSSINRVFEAHGDELAAREQPCEKGARLTFKETVLENGTYGITVVHVFTRENGVEVVITGQEIAIDTLAEEFPDCDVGY